MLETLLKLYSMAMATGVTSPVPHMFGPPGCGKSSTVEQLAELVGVNLHIINVSRMNPLETEGLQMPVDDNTRIHMIPAAFWSRLKANDIVLFDEFLRGFPEVYNGLLDIFTSRRAGEFVLPPVFIVAASNDTVTYTQALEDRLIHLPVPDPRSGTAEGKRAKKHLAQLMVDQLGLLPEMVTSTEMTELLDLEVLPMYAVLDLLKSRASSGGTVKGSSLRKLIGQAQLREVQSSHLRELLAMNNRRAIQQGKEQYVFLLSGRDIRHEPGYEAKARALVGNDRLTETQALNLRLNLELIELEAIRIERGTADDDDLVSDTNASPF